LTFAVLLSTGIAPAVAQQPPAPKPSDDLIRLVRTVWTEGPRWRREAVRWLLEREATDRLLTILTGEKVNNSWFRPAQSRYSAAWFLERFDADGDGAVSRDEFPGPKAWFDRLDRDEDGRITAADLDWTKAAGPMKRPGGKGKEKVKVNKEEERAKQLKAFLDGDVGSWLEGPGLSAKAPDFALPTVDGKRTLRLSDSFGKKPVVLVFGSFT
jgi:hypothetical protein